jgi:hypothetical protein
MSDRTFNYLLALLAMKGGPTEGMTVAPARTVLSEHCKAGGSWALVIPIMAEGRWAGDPPRIQQVIRHTNNPMLMGAWLEEQVEPFTRLLALDAEGRPCFPLDDQ